MMYETVTKNRAVIINKEDLKELEFMLWMYDLRIINVFENIMCNGKKMPGNFNVVYFRCSDEKYNKIYEKMDSLGLWKGDFVNPRFEWDFLRADDINLIVEDVSKRYLMIGV